MNWNPRKRLGSGKVLSKIPTHRRVDNFGDLLGPLIVRRILDPVSRSVSGHFKIHEKRRLLSIGSIMHFSRPGDVIWGSGINGKIAPSVYQLSQIDVRSVRGPLTAERLKKAGLKVPSVYGDPALLLPQLFPQVMQWATVKRHDLVAVPNLNDITEWKKSSSKILDPRTDVWECIRTIAQSKTVVASSLHALIVADSLGIPTVGVRSPYEADFKYHDYYEGTGRRCPAFANSVEEALEWTPQAQTESVTADDVLDAFPWDLWK